MSEIIWYNSFKELAKKTFYLTVIGYIKSSTPQKMWDYRMVKY